MGVRDPHLATVAGVGAEEAAAEATPEMPRDQVATVIQVAGNRLPLAKGRRPVPPTIQTTETMTRALTMKMKAQARDRKTSRSNVGSLTR